MINFKAMLKADKELGRLQMTCPYCGSLDWTSVERNADRVNIKIKCVDCGKIRERKKEKCH